MFEDPEVTYSMAVHRCGWNDAIDRAIEIFRHHTCWCGKESIDCHCVIGKLENLKKE